MKKKVRWAAGALIFFCLFGNQGFRQLVSELAEKRHLQKSLAALRREHAKLAQELSLIQNEPAYTEYLLRKLGYVKKGEVEYRFIRSDKRSGKASD